MCVWRGGEGEGADIGHYTLIDKLGIVPGSMNLIDEGRAHEIYDMMGPATEMSGGSVANTIAGLRNGARQVEVTVNGIGERAGNCSLEEAVMALKTRHDLYGLETGIDARRISRDKRKRPIPYSIRLAALT